MGHPGRVLWLALFLCLGVPLLSPPASAHPYHLMIDNPILGTAESLHDTRWVAQSFVPATDFVVTRISLFVQDQGTSDILSVSVRDCCVSGLPGSNTLVNG